MAKLAGEQHGVVSRVQLRRLGMGDDAIDTALVVGKLHPVFRGVFAVGHPRIGQRGRMFAATLACGEGAVVSHRSAAALMGLLDRAPVAIHVTARCQRGRKIDGIRSHPANPRVDETGTFGGIPCTSPARTLVDIATEVGARTLRSCFERAAARKMLDVAAIESSLRPGRPGAPAIRALLGEWRPALPAGAQPRLKSPLEGVVLPLLAKRGLPAPRCNTPVELAEGRRIEIDFLWEEQRFMLEADSRDYHATDLPSSATAGATAN